MTAATVLAALGIGYLIGSVLPADLLASARGVDIRSVGTRNPGTTNVWEVLGPGAGIATAIFDLAKGVAAMGLAALLGLTAPWTYAAGVAAVVGHRYPLWAHFRGGQGTATSTGLGLYCLGVSLTSEWLSLTVFAGIVAVGAAVFVVTRHGSIVGAAVLPLLVIAIAMGSAPGSLKVFSALTFGFVWVVQIQLQLAKRRTQRATV
jgi:acyl phosphate:glycerol-3-phosphate acyltransferase